MSNRKISFRLVAVLYVSISCVFSAAGITSQSEIDLTEIADY